MNLPLFIFILNIEKKYMYISSKFVTQT